MNILFFMKPKNEIAYIQENYTLRQALEKMNHYGYSTIAVLDSTGKYIGILSEGDILKAILEHEAFDNKTREVLRVRSIIHERQKDSVNVNTEIEDLMLMDLSQSFMPVTDDRGYFIGIVTRSEILKYYYRMADRAIEDRFSCL